MPYYAVLHVLLNYFTVAVVVKMPRIVLTSAELITGTCTRLICTCRSNFAFKMIINAILCHFHLLFPCGRVGKNANSSADQSQDEHRHMYEVNLPMPE